MRSVIRGSCRQFPWIGVVAVLIALSVPQIASAQIEACRPGVMVEDYLAPLDSFPPIREFQNSGRLGAGPASLRVFPPRSQLVVSGMGRLESRGELSGGSQKDIVLGWTAISWLERVSRRGVPGRVVREKQQFIARAKGFRGRSFGFGADVRDGFYRLSVSFVGQGAKRLGTYAEYFRVVEPLSSASLEIDSAMLRTGETGYVQVQNHGTVATRYSNRYRIWNLGGPIPVELSPGETHVTNEQPVVRAGEVGSCLAFEVPAGAPPGPYRIEVQAWDHLQAKPKLLSARFDIS